MATVAQHLEHNRKELLDLSTRNRLLSIPKASKSARLIQVVDERSDQIYKILVEDKKMMSFLPGRKSSDEGDEEINGHSSYYLPLALPDDPDDSDAGSVAKRHSDLRLQTALSPEGLQRRLLGLHTDARTLQEEQGVNVLFIALGQLKWMESSAPESARFAPLVLVPIELIRQTASDKFKVQWPEQEVQENLSLAAKLESDFGITMPEFGDSDDFDIQKYFAALKKCIRERPDWEVLPNEMTLGFFSFAKLMGVARKSGAAADSPFEEAVRAELESHGLKSL